MQRNPEHDEHFDTGVLIKAIPRGGDELRVSLRYFRGRPRLDVRWWYSEGGVMPLRPTRRGIAIRMSEVEGVCEALRKGQEIALEAEAKTPEPGSMLDRMLAEAERRAER